MEKSSVDELNVLTSAIRRYTCMSFDKVTTHSTTVAGDGYCSRFLQVTRLQWTESMACNSIS